jgi:hypothetical protein
MAELIGGLAILGIAVASKINSSENKTANKIKSKVTDNIYNSNNLPKNRSKLQFMADDKFEQSHHIKETGVIPKYYNRIPHETDSVFSDDGSSDSTSVASNDKPLIEKADDMIKGKIEKWNIS